MHVILVNTTTNVVDNVISADSAERAQEFYPDYLCIVRGDSDPVGPGDGYLALTGTFTPCPPPPQVPRQAISKLDFLSRFTQQQRISIRSAGANNAVVGDAMYMLDLAENVRIDHDDTIFFVNYLAQVGLIASSDAERILS